jgi:hypothetical protein
LLRRSTVLQQPKKFSALYANHYLAHLLSLSTNSTHSHSISSRSNRYFSCGLHLNHCCSEYTSVCKRQSSHLRINKQRGGASDNHGIFPFSNLSFEFQSN